MNVKGKDIIKNPLPLDWRWAKLREVCDFLDKKRVPINEQERDCRIAGKKRSELYPYYGANGQVGWIDDYIFDEDLILLAEDGGFFGSYEKPISYKISGKTWVNNHAHVLRTKENIDYDFCSFMLSIRPDIGTMVTGNTRPKLNQDIAANIPIPLPPLHEQKRIAAILNEKMAAIDKARAAAEVALEEAKSLPAAYLRDVFQREGQALPPSWRWVKLGEAIVEAMPGFAIGTRDPKGIIQLRMNNVDTRGRLNWNEFIRVPIEEGAVKRYRLLPGDVIFNNTNSTELVGKSAIFTGYPEQVVYSNHFTRIRTKADQLDSNYLSSWLQSQWQKRIFENLCNRWIGQSAIKNDILLNLSIPLPPLPEQKRIAAILNKQMAKAENLRKNLENQLREINALPAALLRKAFNGEL